nr:MAG TPA: hypothetical protein [Bacteriophage sp.]
MEQYKESDFIFFLQKMVINLQDFMVGYKTHQVVF